MNFLQFWKVNRRLCPLHNWVRRPRFADPSWYGTMRIITPEIERYFQSLQTRLAEARLVSFENVSLADWQPKPSDCHNNVDYWTTRHVDCTRVGDLALVEKTSIKLALNYPDLVHTKAQMRSHKCFLGASGFGIRRIPSSERVDAPG